MQDEVCTLYCCSPFQKGGKNNEACWLFYSGPNTKPQLCQNFAWLVFKTLKLLTLGFVCPNTSTGLQLRTPPLTRQVSKFPSIKKTNQPINTISPVLYENTDKENVYAVRTWFLSLSVD